MLSQIGNYLAGKADLRNVDFSLPPNPALPPPATPLPLCPSLPCLPSPGTHSPLPSPLHSFTFPFPPPYTGIPLPPFYYTHPLPSLASSLNPSLTAHPLSREAQSSPRRFHRILRLPVIFFFSKGKGKKTCWYKAEWNGIISDLVIAKMVYRGMNVKVHHCTTQQSFPQRLKSISGESVVVCFSPIEEFDDLSHRSSAPFLTTSFPLLVMRRVLLKSQACLPNGTLVFT